MPSLAEGFGLVAIEALACGAAVIAANTSALPEATQGAALLLDPYDAELWSEAIRGLLDDDAARRAWRARAVARFAHDDRTGHVTQMKALLREASGDRT